MGMSLRRTSGGADRCLVRKFSSLDPPLLLLIDFSVRLRTMVITLSSELSGEDSRPNSQLNYEVHK